MSNYLITAVQIEFITVPIAKCYNSSGCCPLFDYRDEIKWNSKYVQKWLVFTQQVTNGLSCTIMRLDDAITFFLSISTKHYKQFIKVS